MYIDRQRQREGKRNGEREERSSGRVEEHRTGLRKRIMGSGHPVVPLMEEGGRGESMVVTQSNGRNTLAHFYGFPVRGRGKKRGAGRRRRERREEGGIYERVVGDRYGPRERFKASKRFWS